MTWHPSLWPDEAGIGAAPASRANAASLGSRPGCDQESRTCAARSAPMPGWSSSCGGGALDRERTPARSMPARESKRLRIAATVGRDAGLEHDHTARDGDHRNRVPIAVSRRRQRSPAASGRQTGTGFLARTNRSKDTRRAHPLTESQTKNTGTNLTSAPDGTPAESQSTRLIERSSRVSHGHSLGSPRRGATAFPAPSRAGAAASPPLSRAAARGGPAPPPPRRP